MLSLISDVRLNAEKQGVRSSVKSAEVCCMFANKANRQTTRRGSIGNPTNKGGTFLETRGFNRVSLCRFRRALCGENPKKYLWRECSERN
jgi:recombination DNA repair RAD52 pathway protein